ncbi:MAG TPA: hypothetical protein VIG25_06950 [Pyrinomonadaceae bacterium]
MVHKTRLTVLVGFTLAALCLASSNRVSSQRRPGIDPNPIGIPDSHVLPRLNMITAFDRSFTLTELEAARNPRLLNTSMRARRDVAWQIIQRLWNPISGPRDAVNGIPRWITWYEQEDIAQLYEQMLVRRRSSPTVDPPLDATRALQQIAQKDLRLSLVSARLGKILRQFTFPEAPDLGPHRRMSTGVIFYSPAYVKHFLDNADRIADCDVGNLQKSISKPPSDPFRRSPRALASPAEPSAEPKNRYALCMDREMPTDAVMVKTAWAPVTTRRVRRLVGGVPEEWIDAGFTDERYFSMGPEMAPQLLVPPAGRWIQHELTRAGSDYGQEPAWGFTVTDERGQKWFLVGMHIAAKTVRTWLWISMFWTPDDQWGWRGDRPNELSAGIPGYRYAMCVASDFTEGDPRPWQHYEYALDELARRQGRTFHAMADVMRGNQWCSNPFIERNMARGNCIGCHQGSPDSFLPTTLSKQRDYNISDFSFSFATNRDRLLEIRRRLGFDSKRKPAEK